MKRIATATWSGTGLEGKGTFSTPKSGAFNEIPYNFSARFKSEDGTAGTNPEELIAAAHASCYSMALSFDLAGAGFPAESIDTVVTLSVDKQDVGWTVTASHIDVKVRATGLKDEQLQQLANKAKQNCPISRLLKTEIGVTAKLG